MQNCHCDFSKAAKLSSPLHFSELCRSLPVHCNKAAVAGQLHLGGSLPAHEVKPPPGSGRILD